ncbi:MAG: oxygen-independent coproporphyrinogen III oxidase [Nevskiaceae bacterium]|nr:oxygen-independent coproporphyrinogen III oxidase [Nevskiaceae bacterium]
MSESLSALLARHGRPAPRYTCYPSVAQWESTPTPQQWIADLDAALNAATGRGLSVYVHIPFCASLCTFCGCHLRVVRNHALARPYVDTLLAEHALYRHHLARSQLPIGELHLGGGTPTFLPPEELDRLLDGLLRHAHVRADANLAVESDPRSVTKAHLAVLRHHGFNRISYGVQDMDPRVQDIVNRPLSQQRLQQAVSEAREAGFACIAFDLIHGLPLQTPDSLQLTMDVVEHLRPERIAFYPYAHVPWIKPGQRRYTEADLPEGDDRRQLYLAGRARLTDAGYVDIGVDQYALPHDSLARALREEHLHRNLMGFTSVTTDALLGLGVSAIGDTVASLAQNDKNQPRYEARVAAGELPLQRGHVLDAADRAIRGHLQQLLNHCQTQWLNDENITPWRSAIEGRLMPLADDGLVVITREGVVVTPQGRPFLRNVCAAFDLRLHGNHCNKMQVDPV